MYSYGGDWGAQATLTATWQGPAFGRIAETTQGRPGDLEGTPSLGPQRLWTGGTGVTGLRGAVGTARNTSMNEDEASPPSPVLL